MTLRERAAGASPMAMLLQPRVTSQERVRAASRFTLAALSKRTFDGRIDASRSGTQRTVELRAVRTTSVVRHMGPGAVISPISPSERRSSRGPSSSTTAGFGTGRV